MTKSPNGLDRKLRGAWKEWLGRGPEEVSVTAVLEKRGLDADNICRKEFSRFQNKFSYISFEVGELDVCFPAKPACQIEAESTTPPHHWNNRGWFHPAYLKRGFVQELAEVEDEDFDTLLAEGYSPLHLATMWNQGFRSLAIFDRFIDIIFEALEAYALKLDSAAVTTIVPVVEGTLRTLQDRLDFAGENTTDRLYHVRRAVAQNAVSWLYPADWIPVEFRCYDYLSHVDEFVWVVDGYVNFLRDELFEDTDDFDRESQLNRHGILHGLFDEYGTGTNFLMLHSMLEMHAFITNMTGESQFLLFPESSQTSVRLGLYLTTLGGTGELRRSVVERLVPSE